MTPRAAVTPPGAERLARALRSAGGRAVSWARREAWRFAAAALIVGGGAVVAQVLSTQFGITRLSMIFLGSVVLVAVWHGAQVAVFAALMSFLVYNFYLTDPRFTFQFAGVDDILTLSVFLAVALATGALAGRVRDEGLRSRARAATMAVLFQASREMSSTADEDELRGSLAARIAEAAKGKACILYQGRTWVAPANARFDAADLAGFAARLAAEEAEPGAGGGDFTLMGRDRWRARALRVDGAELGLAIWKGEEIAAGRGRDQDLIPVLADLGAAAIARARLSLEKSDSETLTRTERLRSALLSSISHDFRTPLSSILASVSSLREFGDRFPKETRDDLLSTIEEETERLNRFVVNLLNMTRLEAGALAPVAGPVDVADIAHGVEARLQRVLGGRRLSATGPDTPVVAAADGVLLEQALANVVDNAIRYSPAGSAITLTVRAARDRAEVDVEDRGPGVAAEETGRIFEKFYRCGLTAAQPGTGLGLSITRGLVEAMGGAVEAGPRRDGKAGLRVSLTLPLWTG
ncbi:MAG: Two-component system, OmpR family, sensor histidine kinase KdpD [Caulobacter sp.]|nr:Two-component system, OmpR family, sensor histidine kinase KdpD [Caulobacter sp.]